ncbi:MAG: hypothetical protein EXR07_05005 [Acetobacteraceae bacterium]|nr:hypothetical protein [Acetobacteraceae bacterium]
MTDPEIWETAGRWFDKTWYLLRNPDVARVAIEPLAHYLRYGEAEGRKPSAWFDPSWYRAIYRVPADESPLAHFLTRRATGKFLPCAALYPATRLLPWRDDADAGVDLFDRYLTDSEVPERELLPDLAVIRPSGLIDATYHGINGSDRYEADLDPALHYCRIGWWSGLRPNDMFDPDWYVTTHPSAAHLGVNPLTHYILEGEPANLRPVAWFDPAWYRDRHAVPSGQLALTHYLAHRGERLVSPNPLFDAPWYVARHGHAIPPGADPFSHYLVWGALYDIAPSPIFDARAWRHRNMAPAGAPDQCHSPVTARNPLVHFLRTSLNAK